MSDSAKLFADINLIQEFTSSYRGFIKRKLIAIVASSNDSVFLLLLLQFSRNVPTFLQINKV